jgi:hypothetical protein
LDLEFSSNNFREAGPRFGPINGALCNLPAPIRVAVRPGGGLRGSIPGLLWWNSSPRPCGSGKLLSRSPTGKVRG